MDDETEKPPERDARGRAVPGYQIPNSGHGGRPLGSRNRLAKAFLDDLHKDWLEHGAEAILAARAMDPVAYLRVIASIVPKEIKVTANEYAHLTDRELADELAAYIARRTGGGAGAGSAEPAAADGSAGQPVALLPVHEG